MLNQQQINQRKEALERSCGVCFICGRPLQQSFAQYSHRIPNKEMYRKKYGSWVIDHTKNGEYSCSLEHNYKIDCGSSYGNHLEVIADILIYEYKKMYGIAGLGKLADKITEEYKKCTPIENT